jgi:hypothetical protein
MRRALAMAARCGGGARGWSAGGARCRTDCAAEPPPPSASQLQRRRVRAALKEWRGVSFTGDAALPFHAAGGAAKAAAGAQKAYDMRAQLASLNARFSRRPASEEPPAGSDAYAEAWRAARAATRGSPSPEELRTLLARAWRAQRRAFRSPREAGAGSASGGWRSAPDEQPGWQRAAEEQRSDEAGWQQRAYQQQRAYEQQRFEEQQRQQAPAPAPRDAARMQHCAALGLDAGTPLSADAVRAAFRTAALRFHPDRQPLGASTAARRDTEAAFKRCGAAAEALLGGLS